MALGAGMPGRSGGRAGVGARAPRGAGAARPARWPRRALLAVAAWPMTTGRSTEDLFERDEVPAAWTAGRARPRPLAGAQRARRGAAGAAVRVLRLGRHLRPDPAGARQASRGRAVPDPVGRPRGDRSAVDHRRLGPGAARAPGPAAAAAGADGGGEVVTGTDDDRTLSGALAPRPQPRAAGAGGPRSAGAGLWRAAALRARRSPPGRPRALPVVRRYRVGGGGLVRVRPRARATRGRRSARRGWPACRRWEGCAARARSCTRATARPPSCAPTPARAPRS